MRSLHCGFGITLVGFPSRNKRIQKQINEIQDN